MARFPTTQAVRGFYNRFGSKQDAQAWYEDPAVDRMLAQSGLETSRAVLEIGCGTGRLAMRLLQGLMPADATYTGIDLSQTMVGLTKERTWPWRQRVTLHEGSVQTQVSLPPESFDHIVSAFVFDIFSPEQIRDTLALSHRWLRPRGRLCLVSLAPGQTPVTAAVSKAWSVLHRVSPLTVGGCRPVALAPFVQAPQWHTLHHSQVATYGLNAEVLVAERMTTP